MVRNILLLFLSIISASHFIGHISALTTEGIANGVLAYQTAFKYQIGILGRPNVNLPYQVLASGVLVSPGWVLSVAHAFMADSDNIKRLLFVAAAGSDNLFIENADFRNILFIYTMDYISDYYANDVAMAKTQRDFALGYRINVLGVARPGELYVSRSGLVSGYGSSRIVERFYDDNSYDVIQVETDRRLRNTTVTVYPREECSHQFPAYVNDKFCGVSVHIEYQYTGACLDDAGSPLVIDNKLVGISSVSYGNCDDTDDGSLYTEMSDYYDFVQAVIQNAEEWDNWKKSTVRI